jgi:hypothetical protein
MGTPALSVTNTSGCAASGVASAAAYDLLKAISTAIRCRECMPLCLPGLSIHLHLADRILLVHAAMSAEAITLCTV